MPIRPSSVRTEIVPASTGSNSGRSPSLSFLITSRARSRDRMSWTWLVTASWSTVVPRSMLLSASGRKKMFSRVSISTRASDL